MAVPDVFRRRRFRRAEVDCAGAAVTEACPAAAFRPGAEEGHGSFDGAVGTCRG